MNETISWDDVRLFLAVARGGGLAAARTATGVSAPTLGRRMLALERGLGVVLFDRGRRGYRLTAVGQEFLIRAERLEQGALALERWRSAIDPRPVVRITAGAWTSLFLARHMVDLAGPRHAEDLVILPAAGRADLSRREADLGVRNMRPDLPGLAGRKLGLVAFAVYAAVSLVGRDIEKWDERRLATGDWLAYAPSLVDVPSAAWLRRQVRRRPAMTCSEPYPVLEAAAAGAGLCVLPCFIGDCDPRLARASAPIFELRHDQWLVAHDDDRHSPPVRAVAERTARLFKAHGKLFSGEAVRQA